MAKRIEEEVHIRDGAIKRGSLRQSFQFPQKLMVAGPGKKSLNHLPPSFSLFCEIDRSVMTFKHHLLHLGNE